MPRDSSNWRNKRNQFPEERRLQILAGLLDLAKRQVFDGVWSDLNTVQVKTHAYGDLEYLTWSQAAAMVEAHAKPMAKARNLGLVKPEEGSKVVGTRKRAASA